MSNSATSFAYDTLEVGQRSSTQKTVTEQDLLLFAAASGDRNPVHLDAQFAAASVFKERIAHGMLSGAFISAALALELPGPGSIYLSQELKFTRPVKIGDRISVELEVLEKLPKGRVRIATNVLNQAGKAVVQGEALVLAPSESSTIELPDLPQFV